jgi:glycosyltransferase involved in cell wall biosynthesis
MINVTVVHPSDPLGIIPGGIETCIRDIIRSAPDDFEFTLLGATTDAAQRPVKTWTKCKLGRKTFNFYPLFALDNPEVQPQIPVTIRFLVPLLLSKFTHKIDILQFHRIEALLAFWKHPRPKFTVIHQNMACINDKDSDIRWKHAPWLYFKTEDLMIPKFSGVYCVHQQGVSGYKERYPEIEDNFNFLPTWMNPDVFYPATNEERASIRKDLEDAYSIDQDKKILLSVGRIDKQKNPNRLLTAMHELRKSKDNFHLLMIGDGVLRKQSEKLIAEFKLDKHVSITGLLANDEVARYLRGSDLLVLASDYEGMPRCVNEALGCGVPVATTDVGEVKKVVSSGLNGEIAKDFSPEAFALAVEICLNKIDNYTGQPCLQAVEPYAPKHVLAPLYQRYRDQAAKNRPENEN